MITAEELLHLIIKEDVIDILAKLGSDTPRSDKNNLYFTTICHHGDSKKLHYFSDTGFFCCYTSCGSMSLYDLLMNVNNWTFLEAFGYVADYKGINLYKRRTGLGRKEYHNEDMDFLEKHLYVSKNSNNVVLPSYDENVLEIFDNYYPQQWFDEGISEDIIKYYEIKFFFGQGKAIIPHRDVENRLIGIRGRSFLKQDLLAGKKYMPITIQKLTYKYPVGFNLYGLFQNRENIKKFKKVIIFEGEKSVLKYASYYGQENCIAIATLGMNMSLYQRDLILSCGTEEIIIAFDKQYVVEALEDENKNTDEYKEYIKYLKSLIKIVKLFINYCSVYVILCWDDQIGYKDAPIDKGKEIFEKLYADRYIVDDIEELEEMAK